MREKYTILSRKKNYILQCIFLAKFLKVPVGPRSQINDLTTWPTGFIEHIERFSETRKIRLERPQKVYNHLGPIKKFGLFNSPELLAQQRKAEMANPDRKYDFRGRDFIERYKEFNLGHAFGLFYKKVKDKGVGSDDAIALMHRVKSFFIGSPYS